MDTNAVADIILATLGAIHARSYRNEAPKSPTKPYIVFTLASASATNPSVDYYLNVDIFDAPHVSVRTIETLSDTIQDALDNNVIRTDALNIHLVLEQRQYVSNTDLTTAQMINLRFVVRSYFIEE
jgi:hypothetical protein